MRGSRSEWLDHLLEIIAHCCLNLYVAAQYPTDMYEVKDKERKEALILVLKKLRLMALDGHKFGRLEYRPEFFDESPQNPDPLSFEREIATLRYLDTIGVIQLTEVYDDGEFMVVVDSIDDDKYQKELSKLGLVDRAYEIAESSDKHSEGRYVSSRLDIHSYRSKNGILYFNGQAVLIVKQQLKLTNPKKESMQGRAMKLLFNDVNSLRNGVPLRKIVNSKGVIQNTLKDFQRKQAKNHIAEINKKFRDVSGGRNLIKMRKDVFYIDPELLEID